MGSPIRNGLNGRGSDGRFGKGNPGGPGNPYAAKVARLRREVLSAVGPRKLKALIRRLYDQAMSGDVNASRLLLDRLLGKPLDVPLQEESAFQPINIVVQSMTPEQVANMRRISASPVIEVDTQQ